MRWCLLRVSLLTLILFTGLYESKANDEKPAELQATDQDSETRKNSGGDADDARDRSASDLSRDELCATVAASAQDNGLPISFFSNLIWQESRFDSTSLSHAGAQGIAQFMPKTAAAVGLADPFDPLQALPASARLLHDLYARFGNLGLAAAAYNAGVSRVNKWLRGGGLPRETRNYVRTITGRPVEQWKGVSEGQQSFPLAKRMPCQSHEAFADEVVAEAAPVEQPKTAARRKQRKNTVASVRSANANKRLHAAKGSRLARTASIPKSQRRGRA